MNETDPDYKRKEKIFIPVLMTLVLFAGWYIFSIPLRAVFLRHAKGDSLLHTPNEKTNEHWTYCQFKRGVIRLSSQNSSSSLEIIPYINRSMSDPPSIFLTKNSYRHGFSQCAVKKNTLEPGSLVVGRRTNRSTVMNWWSGTLDFNCQENNETLEGSIDIRYCTE